MPRLLLCIGLLLFTSTLSAQYGGDTLEIAVYDSPPFGMRTPTGEVGGLMVELWEDIAKELNLSYRYTLTDMNGVMGGLKSRAYDVGLGAISITPKREKLVDFTHAVNPSGTGIAVSKHSVTPSFLKKWTPVLIDLLELIAGLLFMLLISAIVVYYIEKQYTGGEEKTDRNINSISDGLWWSAVTMTTVGYGDKVPRSRAGRVIGIVWIFISIIFFSLFTANTSAKLANSRQSSNPINSLEDLFNPNLKVVAVAKSSGEEYLIRENVKYDKKNDIEAAIQAVINGEADAVVSNVPVLKYHNKTNFGGELLVAKELLLRNNMGIALQDDSPIKEMIDLELLQKISEAKWQAAVYKYIGE